MSAEALSHLRALLIQTPSWKLWLEICDHLQHWPDVESRELGLAYTQEHLSSWPDYWRKPTHHWPKEHIGHSLTINKPRPLQTFPHRHEVWCPPGIFTVGTNKCEQQDEGDYPLHQVELTRGLWVHQYLITHREWAALMEGTPSLHPPPEGQEDRYPVDNVNWYGAMAYCNALSRAEGLEEAYILTPKDDTTPNQRDFRAEAEWKGFDCEGYRLPTEHEWEVFARAGCQDDRYGPVHQIAYFHHEFDDNGMTRVQIPPIGTRKPNAWGLYDTLGTFWEWTMDGSEADNTLPFHPSPTEPLHEAVEWKEGVLVDPLYWKLDREIILRGASWSELEEELRFTIRFLDYCHLGDEYSGFRPVRKG